MSPQQHLEQQRARDAQPHTATERIAIVGLSPEGLALAKHAVTRGFSVFGLDDDEVRAAQLSIEETPGFAISSERSQLSDFMTYIVSAPAPLIEGTFDYGYLKDACETLAPCIRAGALVVVETPVEPGVIERTVLPILEKHSTLSRHQFDLAHCPRRDTSPDGRWTIVNTPRVIAGLTRESTERAHMLYDQLLDAEIHQLSSIREAEAVTLLERSFADVNAALVNELAIAFHDAGIDTLRVVEAASTKPFNFLAHVPGFNAASGTSDPYRALRRERRNGYEHRFLAAAHKTNRAMPAYVVRMLTDALREKRVRMKGTVVALLGLGENEESDAAREVRMLLKKKGIRVRTFDPLFPTLSSVRSLEEALQRTDAALILAERDAFSSLSPEDFIAHRVSVVIDGMNCLDKAAFAETPVRYRGLGR